MRILLFILIIVQTTFASEKETTFSDFVGRSKLEATFALSSIKIKTNASPTTQSKQTSYTSFLVRPAIGYAFFDNINAGIFYEQSLTNSPFLVNGHGAFGRYYFWGKGRNKIESGPNLQIEQKMVYNLYAELTFLKKSLEAENLSLQFSGSEIGVGAEAHYKNNFYKLSLLASSLTAGSLREMTAVSIGLGIGKSF